MPKTIKRIQMDKVGMKSEFNALTAKLVEKNIITAQEKEDFKPIKPIIEPIKK